MSNLTFPNLSFDHRKTPSGSEWRAPLYVNAASSHSTLQGKTIAGLPIPPAMHTKDALTPLAPPPVALAAPNVDSGSSIALKILLGGMSNATASMVSNPFDIIKVRQQLLLTSSAEAPSNFIAIFRGMWVTEGPSSLWKGLTASAAREMSYSGIRMGTFDLFRSGVRKVAPKGYEDSFGAKVAAGLGSGMMGAAIANPADLIKVRMQAPAAGNLTFVGHWKEITRTAGVAGLYRAVGATIIRAGLLTSSQLASYTETKSQLLKRYPNIFQEGLQTHFAASGVAGFVCSVCSAPVDTIKVRLMNDSQNRYKNAMHCVALLIKDEGPLSLYKGFSMCWLRLWPHTIVSLVVFEQLRRLAGLKPM